MKKILEYKVFDLLQNKDNEEFLDKVKKENPDLYSKFLNILGNKGLEKAKEKYQQYDPEFVKSEISRKKKEKTKEYKEEERSFLLSMYKDEIEEMEGIVSKGTLKTLTKEIKNKKGISTYLNSLRARKKYTSFLSAFLRDPNKFRYQITKDRMKLEYLSFTQSIYDGYGDEPYKREVLVVINYLNNKKDGKDFYLRLDFPMVSTQEDIMRGHDYASAKMKNINKLTCENTSGSYYLTEDELIERINKIEYYLSDKYFEDWGMENDVKKFNI